LSDTKDGRKNTDHNQNDSHLILQLIEEYRLLAQLIARDLPGATQSHHSFSTPL
jgi:hypothetical protein